MQDVTAGASDNLRRQLKITPNSGLSVIVASAHGEEAYFAVEERFLLPLIKTPREVDGYLIREESLRWRVLLLPPDKDYIDKLKVARYIRWGEKPRACSSDLRSKPGRYGGACRNCCHHKFGSAVLRPAF